jgi:transposase
MTGSTHLSTWVDAETKLRFGNVAVRQGLSESALLKRLVGQMLASVPEETLAPISSVDLRDARVTVRLVPEDRALLRERAMARNMPAATYVSVLVRAHLRHVAPLPDPELAALRAAVNDLAILGRHLNTIARLLQQDRRDVVPGQRELFAMLKICDVAYDRFRDLIRANLVSWEVGYAEKAA